MKIGLSVRIDVTKIDKSRLYKGEKGTYLDLTTFVDTDSPDQFGNNGFITQSQTKEERQAGGKMPILGNSKVFFTDGNSQSTPVSNGGVQGAAGIEDDIPFAPHPSIY